MNSQFHPLSRVERLVLELIVAEGEAFGLQLVDRSGGRLKRGTVYVTLGRMQEKGYLDSRQEALPEGAIGLPRRLYRPTAHALRLLEACRAAERVMAGTAHLQEA
jgi:DNA-binding PadR family transcriptional regulator